jgi:hypothetical protein
VLPKSAKQVAGNANPACSRHILATMLVAILALIIYLIGSATWMLINKTCGG